MHPLVLLIASIPLLGLANASFLGKAMRMKSITKMAVPLLAALSSDNHNRDVYSRPYMTSSFRKPFPSTPFRQSGPCADDDWPQKSNHERNKEDYEHRYSQKRLIRAMAMPKVVCRPETFFVQLMGLKISEDQEEAVSQGVIWLFPKNTKCIKPLLVAMKGRTFLSERLRDIAVQVAFGSAAVHGDEKLMNEFYRDPAITSEKYAEAMKWEKESTLEWLLEHADHNDLIALKEDEYAQRRPKLTEAIDNAMSKVDRTKTRINLETA